jgi:hypothetical protein
MGQLVVVGVVIEFLVLPQLAGEGRSLRTLLDVDSAWLLLALLAELASFAAFAAATRTLIPHEHRPPWRHVLRIDLATIGLNHSVPGGSAAGTALGLRLLNEEGVPVGEAALAKVAQGIGSSVILIVLMWIAVAIAIPVHGSSPIYLTASAVGLVVVLAAVASVVVLRHRRELAARILSAASRRLPFVADDAGGRIASRVSDQLELILSDPPRLAGTIVWTTANWLLDTAALWAALRAYGHAYDYDGLVVAFTLAKVAGWVPIVPGGLGVVEGVLIPSLLTFGGSRGTVVLGVITYRLMSYWLTIPLGALAYGGIAGRRWRRRRRGRRSRPLP